MTPQEIAGSFTEIRNIFNSKLQFGIKNHIEIAIGFPLKDISQEVPKAQVGCVRWQGTVDNRNKRVTLDLFPDGRIICSLQTRQDINFYWIHMDGRVKKSQFQLSADDQLAKLVEEITTYFVS